MKILLACQQSPHVYPLPAYRFWRTYFVEGLREAGHEIVEVPAADWARGLLPLSHAELDLWRTEIWEKTLECARSTAGIDLFLSYLYPSQIEREAVAGLRRIGIPSVNFFCDNVREYRRLPAEFACFDLHWVPEMEALPNYARRGWRALSAPMPCWIPPSRRRIAATENNEVAFVGRHDPLRGDLLAAIARAGLPLAVYGRGYTCEEHSPASPPTWAARISSWSNFYARQGLGPTLRRLRSRHDPATGSSRPNLDQWLRPSPDDEHYPDILAQSSVCLGINRYPSLQARLTTPTYSRLRDIEAPMLGACYLTEWAPELASYYELGKEIEVYRDETELIEKARALLRDSNLRLRLRVQGQRRALAEHTVGRTVARIAQALGLRGSYPQVS